MAQLYVARNAKTILLQCAWQVPVSCIKVKQWDRGFRGIFMYLAPGQNSRCILQLLAGKMENGRRPAAWRLAAAPPPMDAHRALKSRGQRTARLNLSAKYWTFPAARWKTHTSYRTVLHCTAPFVVLVYRARRATVIIATRELRASSGHAIVGVRRARPQLRTRQLKLLWSLWIKNNLLTKLRNRALLLAKRYS